MKQFKRQHPDATRRREGVIKRLEAQLKSGTKPDYIANITNNYIPLTDSDKKRIEKELLILKSRV